MITTQNYSTQETRCEQILANLGRVFHLWTPENFEVIFVSKNDFIAAMNIIGIVAMLFPDIVILTFQVMSNHLHFTICGDETSILAFFEKLRRTLSAHFTKQGRSIRWEKFNANIRELTSLNDVRNVIIYNNRNGYLVSPDHTPFSYPWGANKYFFNPAAVLYDRQNARPMPSREKRFFLHTHEADSVGNIYAVDGCCSPVYFCRLDAAQAIFRNASNYFYRLGRSVESQKEIAKEIGESVFYTDDELYSILCRFSKTHYNVSNPSMLPVEGKQEAARMLHFDFNSSGKQICRMLKLSLSVLASMGINE